MKAIFFMIIGALCAYLYMNPGDIDGATDMIKSGVNQSAQTIVELTE
jgi:hypothetical protein